MRLRASGGINFTAELVTGAEKRRRRLQMGSYDVT